MDTMPGETLRLIDANLNRAGEGLRVLEDIARLLLNDAALTEQLKNIRHEVVKGDALFNRQLLESRDSEADVGMDIQAAGDQAKRDLPTTVVANSRRVQESLRVMEELARVPGVALEPDRFKHARFALYTIEKALLSRLMRRDKLYFLSSLYVIIDTEALKGRSHTGVAAQAIRGGARVIQLRDKVTSKRELMPIAQGLRDLCAEQGALFIINDYLDLTLAVGADGLHLGQDDLPVKAARRLLPVDKLLGSSVTTVDQAVTAQAEGADYVAVSAIYPTASKADVEVVGLERLRQVRQAVALPVVALGGINKDNIAEVRAAGAGAVAVISAVLGAEDVTKACRQILEGFKHGQTE